METCDVCLQDAPPVVAGRFSAVDEDDDAPVTVRFCRVCATALFQLLEQLYRRTVEENNRSVADAMRLLGMPPMGSPPRPPGVAGPGIPPDPGAYPWPTEEEGSA